MGIKGNEKEKRSITNQKVPILGNQKKASSAIGSFEIVYMIFCAILVFYPPFFRGLYFEDEQFPAQILAFLLMAGLFIYRAVKRDWVFFRTPVDYSFLALVLIYGLSLFVAVNFRSALSELLKYCFYFSCFYVVSDIFRSVRQKRRLMWVIVSSTVGVCIISLDGALGAHKGATYGPLSDILNQFLSALSLKKSFFDVFLLGKIYSTLQYSNAFASFAFAVFLLSLVLLLLSKGWLGRGLAGGMGFFIFTSILYAQSRALTLLILPVMVLFFLLLPKGDRLKAFIHSSVLILLAGVCFAVNFDNVTKSDGNGLKMWTVFLAGIVVSGLVVVGIGALFAYFRRIREEEMNFAFVEASRIKLFLGIAGAVLVVMLLLNALTAHEPLVFDASKGQTNAQTSVIKSVSLEPGKLYQLSFFAEGVSALTENKSPGTQSAMQGIGTFTIDIFSKNIRDILNDSVTPISSHTESIPSKAQRFTYDFKVPADSQGISIKFSKVRDNAKVSFSTAGISTSEGHFVKGLRLKYKYLPDSVVNRFENLSSAKSTIERGIFYRDGMELFRDRPVLGAGGGAWNYIYQSKQSYLYWTTQAHNFLLQLGIETGILGLLVFAGMVLFVILLYVTEFIRLGSGPEERDNLNLQAGFLCAMLAMLVHSVFDFDFSLSAVFLLFSVILGMYHNRYFDFSEFQQRTLTNKLADRFFAFFVKLAFYTPKVKIHPLVISGLFLILALLPLSLYSGIKNANQAKSSVQSSADLARNYISAAVDADPFRAEYKNMYAEILLAKGETKEEFLKAKKLTEEALSASQYALEDLVKVGTNFLRLGEIERAIQTIKRTTELSPKRESVWSTYLEAFYRGAMYDLELKKTEDAKNLINEALKVPDAVMEKNKFNILPFRFESNTMHTLERLHYSRDYPERTAEEVENLVFYLLKTKVDSDLDGKPDQFEFQAGSSTVNPVYTGMEVVLGNPSSGEAYLKTRSLKLEKGTAYKIELKPSSKRNFRAEGLRGQLTASITGIGREMVFKEGNGVYSVLVTLPNTYAEKDPTLTIRFPNGEVHLESVAMYKQSRAEQM